MSFTAYASAIAGSILTASFWNAQVKNNGLVAFTSIDTATGRISGEILTFREEITSVAYSATPTFNLALSNNFKLGVLTGNVTAITVTGWTAGKDTTAKIRLTQDATGGRTVALPAGWRWSNNLPPTMPTGANKAMTIILNSDDGTTIFASLFVINA